MEIYRIVNRLAQTQQGIIQTRRFPRIGYGLRFDLEMSPSRRFDKLHCSSASAAQPRQCIAALPFRFLRGRMKGYVGWGPPNLGRRYASNSINDCNIF